MALPKENRRLLAREKHFLIVWIESAKKLEIFTELVSFFITQIIVQFAAVQIVQNHHDHFDARVRLAGKTPPAYFGGRTPSKLLPIQWAR